MPRAHGPRYPLEGCARERRWMYCMLRDAYKEVSGRAKHDYREIGGRVTPGAVTEEARAEESEAAISIHGGRMLRMQESA